MDVARDRERLELWLADSPLDTMLTLDQEQVFLKVGAEGAELGAVLMPLARPGQLDQALRLGFSSALEFSAGLACSNDGSQLLLTQWLPGVRQWRAASVALELLLEQCASWRALLEAPARPVAAQNLHGLRSAQRQQQRLLGLLQEKTI